MDCLTGISGVANDTTIPFWNELDGALTQALMKSTSTLYAANLPGGIDLTTIDSLEMVQAVLKCGLDANIEAIKVTQGDIIMKLNTLYKRDKKNFNGNLGRPDFTSTLNTTGTLHGMRLRMRESIGGNIKIGAMRINVNGPATFNVYIAKCNARDYAAEIIKTYEVTTTANSWTTIPLGDDTDAGITLPMQVQGIAQEYWIFYNRTEALGVMPKNNQIKCNCVNDNVYAVFDYMDVHGVAFEAIGNVRSVASDLYGHGLSISANVGCDDSIVMCREYDTSSAMQQAMAWAVNFKTGMLWIENLLKSNYVSREIIQSREYMYGKRNAFEGKYGKQIDYIGINMNLDETNCYTCGKDKMFYATIRP